MGDVRVNCCLDDREAWEISRVYVCVCVFVYVRWDARLRIDSKFIDGQVFELYVQGAIRFYKSSSTRLGEEIEVKFLILHRILLFVTYRVCTSLSRDPFKTKIDPRFASRVGTALSHGILFERTTLLAPRLQFTSKASPLVF